MHVRTAIKGIAALGARSGLRKVIAALGIEYHLNGH